MNRDARRLQDAVAVTTRAAARLKSSLADDRSDLIAAIASENVEADKHLLRVLDSFVQRFQQIHEHMTHRLYPAIYRAEELGARLPAMLELLTWLEDHGLVEERRNWAEYAEARNRLVHEYPLEQTARTDALNLAVEYAGRMLHDPRSRAGAHSIARSAG